MWIGDMSSASVAPSPILICNNRPDAIVTGFPRIRSWISFRVMMTIYLQDPSWPVLNVWSLMSPSDLLVP